MLGMILLFVILFIHLFKYGNEAAGPYLLI